MIKIQNTRKVQEKLLENQRQVIEDNSLYIVLYYRNSCKNKIILNKLEEN